MSGNAPTISVSGVACGGASVVEAASEYADAGASTANTNGFRWSDDTPGLWIYNLDTKGLGLATGACYRIDTSLGSQISTQAWLVVQVTK